MPELRRAASAALAALLWAAGALAQAPPGATPQERALLARADAEWAAVQARAERKTQAERELLRARLVESGGLAVVVPGRAPAEQAQRGLDSVAALLRDFGGVPAGFERTVVIVFANATDTGAALASPVARGRQRVSMVGVQLSAGGGGAPAFNLAPQVVANAIAWAYRETRDADWRAWLPGNYGIGPWSRNSAWSAFQSLTRSPWAAGARCVSGDPAGCRLWLGVDRDSSAYRARFRADELRAYVEEHLKWTARRTAAGRDCLGGSGDACFAYAFEAERMIPAIPADEEGRRSLVRAVRALHGADALQRALTDTAGSVGERFARAAGVGEDSLMHEWRYWVLTRGGRPQDRNLLADAAPAVLLAGLLLAAARRSRG